jgi:spermidine synthase
VILAQSISEHGETILRTGTTGYEVIVNGQFLMSSASGGSSRALIEFGMELLPRKENLAVLIGGLGLGFSLQTALDYKEVERVTVVEIEPSIIHWYHQDLIPGALQMVKDARTQIIQRDFTEYIRECRELFHLIALDIDNGPEWLSHESNGALYTPGYLLQVKKCLVPGGIVAFWSADESPVLEKNLAEHFETVTCRTFNDHNGEGRVIPAYIYLAADGYNKERK